jgi:membrane protein
MKPRELFNLVRTTFSEGSKDHVSRLAASLSYFTAFSLAPLLVIAIGIAALVFGQEAAQGQIFGQLRSLVGDQGAAAVQEMLANSRQQGGSGIVASAIAVVTLLLGATGAFVELKGALNVVWNVLPAPSAGGVMGLLRGRLLSLAMVLAVGFLLIVSLVVSAALAAAEAWIGGLLPGWETLLWVLNTVVSFAVITALFALLLKYLPDTEIAWRDVWVGAALTALLFTLGKTLIGLYLGRSSVASTYGAAGSVVVVIVWVYYAAQIFFFGAELTQAYAHRHGSRRRQAA